MHQTDRRRVVLLAGEKLKGTAALTQSPEDANRWQFLVRAGIIFGLFLSDRIYRMNKIWLVPVLPGGSSAWTLLTRHGAGLEYVIPPPSGSDKPDPVPPKLTPVSTVTFPR